MQRAIFLLLFVVLIAPGAPLAADRLKPLAPSQAKGGGTAAVDAIVMAEPDKWSVRVVSLDNGRLVYEHNSTATLQPASNEKVLTTAAALDALGPSWTTRTSVYTHAEPDNGVIRGDLVLYGRGDPNLSGRFSNTNDPLEPLRNLAAQLHERGIWRVEGGLIADESYLSGAPYGSGWGWADVQWHFGAEVSALSFNDNLAELHVVPGSAPGQPAVVQVVPDIGYVQIDNLTTTTAGGPSRVIVHRGMDSSHVQISGSLSTSYKGWTGEIAVPDPARYTGEAFRRALADAGIEVVGETRKVDAYCLRDEGLEPDNLVELASLESHSLAEMIRVVNKHSQNLHAELILRMLGRERGPAQLPSDEAGISVVLGFLDRIGAATPGMTLCDGSGLSRLNRVSAGMLERVVEAMDRHPWSTFFLDSLPEAGVDGTLRRRLGGVSLRAKTGSLATAKALSGFLTTKSGQRFSLSAVYNDPHGAASGIGKIDRIALAISEL